jgi:hypothetical protein
MGNEMRNVNRRCWVVCLFVVQLCFCQTPNDTLSKDLQSKFDIHFGLGLSNGARIGARYLINRQFTLESSVGIAAQNLIGATDMENRYAFGVGWHPSFPDPLFFSLLLITRTRPNLSYPNSLFEDNYVSVAAGSMSLSQKGIGFFFRIGFTVGYTRQRAEAEKKVSFGPDVDVAIRWAF